MTRIFSNLNMYCYIALISAIFSVYIHNHFLKKSIETLSFQVNYYENQIVKLKSESDAFEEKVNVATEGTINRLQKKVVEANNVLNLQVSNDCEEAMNWAKEQAAKI